MVGEEVKKEKLMVWRREEEGEQEKGYSVQDVVRTSPGETCQSIRGNVKAGLKKKKSIEMRMMKMNLIMLWRLTRS